MNIFGRGALKVRKFWNWLAATMCLGVVVITSFGYATPPMFRVQMDGVSPYYVPRTIEIPVGASVMWENPTGSHHTITHNGCRDEGECMFDSGAVAPNSQFALDGLAPGHYPYHCTLHPIMEGVLVVMDTSPQQSI